MKPGHAWGRTLRCTVEERLRIERRAEAAGMTVSAFVMASAFQDDEAAAAARPVGHPLVLSVDEQQVLLETVTRLEAGWPRRDAPLPEVGLSLEEGLRVLARMSGGSDGKPDGGA